MVNLWAQAIILKDFVKKSNFAKTKHKNNF